MIHIDDDAKCFHLRAKDSSYVINCFDGRYLIHGYWGEALSSPNPSQMSTLGACPYLITEPLDEASLERYKRNWIQEGKDENRSCPSESSSIFSPEKLTLEYPIAGMGDLRTPALRVRLANGSASGFLSYQGYARLGGCPGPDGLPYISHAPFDCETLRIDLKDEFSGIQVSLFYLPLQDLPIVLRWVRLINTSGKTVEIEAIASVSLDLPGFDGDMVSLNGSWGRERHFHRRPVSPGVQMVESRGASSSHQHAPFLGLADREATERWGRVWGLSLIYSGNHRHLAERSQYGTLRLQCGINPDGFSFRLPPGEHFDAPAAVLVWSCQGFSALSEAFHGFTRACLLPAQWRNTDRPIVINTWEAHYFDVNIDKAAALAREGKKIGAEVLVLDDGWFVNRRDDKRALGDWAPDSGKFPGGLREAARRINDLGMKFGIWMEPEMVSPDSDLYRRHPDWILSAPGRNPSLARNPAHPGYGQGRGGRLPSRHH